jgi:hypothetical protein
MFLLHPLLLGGLVLMGVPVLLHLMMRQKPKHLMFPAFRFLQQRAKTNQRKIRLRHLLLLLLRMLLIALIVLALVRPRVFSDRFNIANQNAAVALVIDTSPSMEYNAAGKTRLEEAKQRALEVLDEVGDGSRVAMIDTGGKLQEWTSVAEAREQIRNLTPKAGNAPVTNGISAAYQKFDELDKSAPAAEGEALPRVLYVISDRTVASWDPGRVNDLIAQRDRLPAPPVRHIFIDVGVDKPIDVAVTQVEVKPQAVPANQEVVIKATVTATGQKCDTELECKLLGEKATTERQPVTLESGQSQVIEFRKKGLKPGQYQVEIKLASSGPIPSADVRYATFEVRGARKILTLTDDEDYAWIWQVALDASQRYSCDVKLPGDIKGPDDLKDYQAVCLLSVRLPGNDLWNLLARYVQAGGNLAIVPGREDRIVGDYNSEPAQQVMPGKLEKIIDAPPTAKLGIPWDIKNFTHPLLAKFREWEQRSDVGLVRQKPGATRYWEVSTPHAANVIVRYADANLAKKDDKEKNAGSPALLERVVGRDKGAGRVILFTTAMDFRKDEADWNDYRSTLHYFYLVLANEVAGYLLGDAEDVNFNFACGQVLALPLPQNARFPEYTVDGPGVTGSDTRVMREDKDTELRIRQTGTAGNFVVSGGKPRWETKFSLNPPPNEFLLDRVPAEEIEKVTGPESLVPAGQNKPLKDLISSRFRQPMELLPWLMALLLIGLAVECYLANRFYKKEPEPDAVMEVQPA